MLQINASLPPDLSEGVKLLTFQTAKGTTSMPLKFYVSKTGNYILANVQVKDLGLEHIVGQVKTPNNGLTRFTTTGSGDFLVDTPTGTNELTIYGNDTLYNRTRNISVKAGTPIGTLQTFPQARDPDPRAQWDLNKQAKVYADTPSPEQLLWTAGTKGMDLYELIWGMNGEEGMTGTCKAPLVTRLTADQMPLPVYAGAAPALGAKAFSDVIAYGNNLLRPIVSKDALVLSTDTPSPSAPGAKFLWTQPPITASGDTQLNNVICGTHSGIGTIWINPIYFNDENGLYKVIGHELLGHFMGYGLFMHSRAYNAHHMDPMASNQQFSSFEEKADTTLYWLNAKDNLDEFNYNPVPVEFKPTSTARYLQNPAGVVSPTNAYTLLPMQPAQAQITEHLN